jgi:hypothetical protein
MTELVLFDPDETIDVTCPVCDAVRPAGRTCADECAHEATHRGASLAPWPTQCLNAPDPSKMTIPY